MELEEINLHSSSFPDSAGSFETKQFFWAKHVYKGHIQLMMTYFFPSLEKRYAAHNIRKTLYIKLTYVLNVNKKYYTHLSFGEISHVTYQMHLSITHLSWMV